MFEIDQNPKCLGYNTYVVTIDNTGKKWKFYTRAANSWDTFKWLYKKGYCNQ